MTDKAKTAGGFILIAEDDRGANNLEARQLEPLGLEIRSTYTAKETIDLLKHAAPVLMLLDYSLPDMSALELLAELEKNKVRIPPFIVITGQGDERMAVAAMKAGAQDYLVKDFSLLDNLLDRARKALVNVALRDDLERTNETLQESEGRFKAFFHGLNEAAFVHEDHKNGRLGRFLEVNDAACAHLGYTRAELLHMAPPDIDAPETSGQVPAMMRRLEAEGRAQWEGMLITKDGRRIPVEINNRYFTLRGKKMIISTACDITDRKKAEAGLSESNELYRTVFNRVRDAILVTETDADGLPLIIDANEAALNLHGYTLAEVTGKPVSFLAAEGPADQPGLWTGRLKCAGETFTVKHRRKDGSVFELEASAAELSIAGRRRVVIISRPPLKELL